MKEHPSPIRILVVDDDKDYTQTQSEWLREEGNETVGVFSEKEAREFLKDHGKELDLALVDMYMEAQDSGLKLVELIDREYPWVVTIIVTGYGNFQDAVRCMEAGAFSYIMKGESPPELIIETLNKASGHLSNRLRVIPFLQEVRAAINGLLQRVGCVEAMLVRIEDELRPRGPEIVESTESNDGE